MKKIILTTLVVLTVIFCVIVYLATYREKPCSSCLKSKDVTTIPVPMPQTEDIIQNFFNLIGEKRASDAVMMMTSKIVNDDSTKQSYGVMFAAMKSVIVRKIEESSKSDWTDTWQQYMITFDIVMDPDSANQPIPFYGFENGENIRFVNLVKENNVWKIEGLATGP
jgi:hypothetical protein